jgi:bifunctional non-homologous end joining protein LigD
MVTAKKAAAKSTNRVAAAKVAGTATRRAKPSRKAASGSKASDAIDQQLARYRSMRDFSITSEPGGRSPHGEQASLPRRSAGQGGLPFVIQKHAASHLHYDFRLGWNGVLKSWASAKGPSYYPGDRRLAVQVEDHPMEYGGFEGIIPQGQYGGGTVMLWDQGTWEPQPGHTNVDADLREGSLKFTLHGTKMKGNWTLVRMGGQAASKKKPNWLLIKEHDSYARTEKEKPITERSPNSVVTKRSLEQIAASEDHIWSSKNTGKGNPLRHKNGRGSKSAFSPPLSAYPKESLPDFISPQLASQATQPPSGTGWLNELKLDGYRIQARFDHEKVQLLTRTGLDWTHRMRAIAAELSKLPAQSALMDGEIVVLREDGNTSFADLQAAFEEEVKKPLTYFLFDLLHLNGHNLRDLPLRERKTLLAGVLEKAGPYLRISEHLKSDAATVFAKACALHAEGIVAKRADAPYTSGRTSSWLKLKCIHEQEFVIGGFTLPAKGHAGIHGVGSLLLGYYDESQKLIYAGRTGTGFTQKTHVLIRTKLERLRQPDDPFSNPPSEARRGAIWVKPILVAQVRFATWTADSLVRQASFQGLREDKPANQVRKDDPAPKPRITRQNSRSKQASHSVASPRAAKEASTKREQMASQAPVRLTHPDKTIDAESKLTKQQLADYYWAIAPHMLPQITGRPISLVRCPEGSTKPCFFQKHTGPTLPEGIETVEVPDKKTGKLEPYITLSTPEGLAGLAQMGVLELHAWGSRNADLEHPDRIVFDLDPDTQISWRTLADAAIEVRKRLKNLGLQSFLKSTGGKGLHIVIPIQPEHDWTTIKQFAHVFVLELEKSNPALYLTKMTKSARAGKIYLDYLRNERGATAVAAYSSRARTGAPVALPLRWNELRLGDRPLFHVANYSDWRRRLASDPWKHLLSVRQKLGRLDVDI